MAQPKKERLGGQATVLHTVIRFLADLHSKSPDFRDFAVSSDYIRLLLAVLFPVVVSTDSVSPDVELCYHTKSITSLNDAHPNCSDFNSRDYASTKSNNPQSQTPEARIVIHFINFTALGIQPVIGQAKSRHVSQEETCYPGSQQLAC
jgi:hypothetical protein